MKKTTMKLNPMPKRGVKPPSLQDDELVILVSPDNNRVMDIIRPASDVNWASRETHFVVLTS